MSTETTTYVTYLLPGIMITEESVHAVAHRDPRQAAADAPADAFAFTFHDQVTATATVDGQEVPLTSRALNKSKRFYIDAEKLTYADVEALDGDHHILLANMRGNRWETMLRCRTGNYQPLEDGDQVITSDGVMVGA